MIQDANSPENVLDREILGLTIQADEDQEGDEVDQNTSDN